jgi:RNA polymerase sigma factor for flagellar operon FliA
MTTSVRTRTPRAVATTMTPDAITTLQSLATSPAPRSPRATLTTTTRPGRSASPRKDAAMDLHLPLWQAMAAGDLAARDQLLKEHLGLVHHVARQMSKTLAVKADFDELVSSGTMGLMSALEAFEPARGLAFSTFAAPRIRGAILDDLRRQDHVPRSIRRKTREITTARETLGRVLGRAATDSEVAEHLGVDRETLWKWQADVEGATHVPIERNATDSEPGTPSPIDILADESGETVEDTLTREQEVHHLRDAILRLKEQERTVLSLYYFEELKLHEIATILKLTESRVSQIRSKALGKLRAELRPLRSEVA